MSEQPTPTTDRPKTGPTPTGNGRTPGSVANAPARRRIATFRDYADAERAVERLTTHGFPIERVAIVGRGLQSVEQIVGRLTFASAAWHGALAGAVPGALVGWIFGLLSWVNPLIASLLLALYGLIFGAILGAIVGMIVYAFQRGRRDFASVAKMQAREFDVVVDDQVADEAARLLGQGV